MKNVIAFLFLFLSMLGAQAKNDSTKVALLLIDIQDFYWSQ